MHKLIEYNDFLSNFHDTNSIIEASKNDFKPSIEVINLWGKNIVTKLSDLNLNINNYSNFIENKIEPTFQNTLIAPYKYKEYLFQDNELLNLLNYYKINSIREGMKSISTEKFLLNKYNNR
ncbi:MAG: hypothetical protein LBR11_02265 [Deltaproteobacteria bacterium]|jgi:hypothetical protein|nr:hypothetical protein [Deltaproteobacteria bacterium]